MIKRVFVLLALTVSSVVAEEKIQLDTDNVIGNEEAPKALYVVPWRPLQPVTAAGLEIESMLDEELELVDPNDFKRKVELYKIKQAASVK
ncbi:MAG: hypothetical protein OEZ43_20355 [Gammaproteobacteria bacterium]|nr:hypothetical protein [Gammaproteobacteria bacterium]